MPTPKSIKNGSELGAEITSMLKSGQTVSIPGLGNFTTIDKPARMGRNPRTGDAVPIPARKAVKHSVAGALKTALNPA